MNELPIRETQDFLINFLVLESKPLIRNINYEPKTVLYSPNQTENGGGENCLNNRGSGSGTLRETFVWLIIWIPIEK